MTSGYLQRVVRKVEMSKGNKKRKYSASTEKVSGFCFARASEEASDVSWARAVDRISKDLTRCYSSMYRPSLSPQLCRKENCDVDEFIAEKGTIYRLRGQKAQVGSTVIALLLL